MLILIKREVLLTEINKIARISNNRSQIPTLSGILFNVQTDKLILIGSDPDQTISIQSEIKENEILKITKTGKFLVKSKFISEIIRKIEGEFITLEVVENQVLRINSENFDSQLNTMVAEEYPEIDFDEDGQIYKIKSNWIKEIINQISFAAANKEEIKVLTGICFKNVNKKLKIIATDAFRLAQKEISDFDFPDFEIIIPAKTIQELSKIINDNLIIDLIINDQSIIFKNDNIILKSKFIQGIYPNTDKVIPNKFKINIKINLNYFLNVIDRANILATENSISTIKMTITKEKINIESKTIEVWNCNETLENFEIDFDGEVAEQVISFNCQYMLDALKSFKVEKVNLGIIDNESPIIITSLLENNLLQLVLPVRFY